MEIPFTKAHGARNDFLLTWANEAPAAGLADAAIAICDRHTGAGADGWLLVSPLDQPPEDADLHIRLFNPDGGEVEMSGNGTRCAAAFAIAAGYDRETIRIRTGGGIKHLQLLRRAGHRFEFEMNMGRPEVKPGELRYALAAAGELFDCTLLWVGNPQCAVFVENFDFDWRAAGAAIEGHPKFPNRTNVSFIRTIDGLNIDVRFFERGAGETQSSGTGSTGAAVSAILRGFTGREVTVHTPAGPLAFRWPADDSDVRMQGPAEIIADGRFYFT
ncbi:MAG: diaminopimelate epimerase [Acidobacteria bacterium]|nr:diaminopimelate epimerase [Acidobacteriota bacterium]